MYSVTFLCEIKLSFISAYIKCCEIYFCSNVHCFISTDNGPHYHNSGFLFYLAEANQVFDLTLVEYNNFEAGEGKSQLDTHFAHMS